MRLSEWILAIYFSYTTLLSVLLPLQPDTRSRTLGVNAALVCLYAVLLGVAGIRDTLTVKHLRNWIPLALMLLAYKEMGWLAPATHTHHFEAIWITWDRLLLHVWRLKYVIESTGSLLPSALELCYLLVYSLPAFCMSMLYVYRKSREAETLLVIYLLGLFLSYAQFPYWPSEPPWIVVPGADAPAITTAVRRFNLWILGGYGIHTSVFPSAHVSGAVAAGFALKRTLGERLWLYRGVFVYTALMAVATVYGRYHYTVDAMAGVIVGVAAVVLGNALLGFGISGRKQAGREPPVLTRENPPWAFGSLRCGQSVYRRRGARRKNLLLSSEPRLARVSRRTNGGVPQNQGRASRTDQVLL